MAAAYEGSKVMEHSTVAHKCQDQSKTKTKPTMDSAGQWRTASTKLHIVILYRSSSVIASHAAVIYNFT